MSRLGICSFVLGLALLTVPPIGHAAESYGNCTGFITSVLTAITAPATWHLKQDLATAVTSGSAEDNEINGFSDARSGCGEDGDNIVH